MNDRAGETALTGGLGAGAVVRIGDTVHRPVGPRSAFVHGLLRHYEAVRFTRAPRFLGFDAKGREVLSFIAGWSPRPDWATVGELRWSDEQIGAVSRLIRRLHDATAGGALAASSETVCHNDLSPFNTVFRDGVPVAFIDFDAAAPGARFDDLAQPFWLYCGLGVGGPPLAEQARRLRLACHAYGRAPADLRVPFRRGSEVHIARHERLRDCAATSSERAAEDAVLAAMREERRWAETDAEALFGL